MSDASSKTDQSDRSEQTEKKTPTALITGASSGIGYDLAKIFAANKFNLVLVARSGDKLEELARELTQHHLVKVKVIAQDLCSMNGIDELYSEIKASGIEVDHLVNNAGFGTAGPLLETSWSCEQRMIQLNIMALTYLSKLFSKEMVARESGRILNVASTAAFVPGPGMSVYFATKAYVLSFSEALASELEGTGVTVTTLCPGPTQTGFQTTAKMETSRLFQAMSVASSEEVARYGFDAMMAGRRVAIPGLMNRIAAEAPRLAPRKLITKLMKRLNDTNV